MRISAKDWLRVSDQRRFNCDESAAGDVIEIATRSVVAVVAPDRHRVARTVGPVGNDDLDLNLPPALVDHVDRGAPGAGRRVSGDVNTARSLGGESRGADRSQATRHQN